VPHPPLKGSVLWGAWCSPAFPVPNTGLSNLMDSSQFGGSIDSANSKDYAAGIGGCNSVGRVLASQAPSLPSADIRHGESNADYHADRAYLSASPIKDFLESPPFFQRRYLLGSEPSPTSDSLTRGTLVHDVLQMGWEAAADQIKVIPADYLTASGALSTSKAAKEWLAAQGTSLLVTPADADFLTEVQAQCDLNKAVAKLLADIKHKEVSIRWQRADGTKLKCRPDAITSKGRVIDYKTTKYKNPARDFHRACVEYQYGLQSALYQEGAAAAGFSGEPLIFVLISTVSPYTVIAKTLPERFISVGKARLDRAIADISARKSFGDWTPDGYGSIDELYMPEWCFKDNQGGDV